jgi:hypothetical protein
VFSALSEQKSVLRCIRDEVKKVWNARRNVKRSGEMVVLQLQLARCIPPGDRTQHSSNVNVDADGNWGMSMSSIPPASSSARNSAGRWNCEDCTVENRSTTDTCESVWQQGERNRVRDAINRARDSLQTQAASHTGGAVHGPINVARIRDLTTGNKSNTHNNNSTNWDSSSIAAGFPPGGDYNISSLPFES